MNNDKSFRQFATIIINNGKINTTTEVKFEKDVSLQLTIQAVKLQNVEGFIRLHSKINPNGIGSFQK